MLEIVDQPIREIDPNAHPHVLLCYFGKPAGGLNTANALLRLHKVIADTSDDNVLAEAADKLTEYCVPVDITPSDRFEISETCLSAMKLIRDRELHAPSRQR
jgi:hypothetical protein